MPEHLRALLVILVIAAAVFGLVEKPICAAGIAPADFKRRRNIWFALTLSAFLLHSFWLYCLVAGLVLVVFGSRDRNPIALYVVLMFVVPPFSLQIPGLGVVNQLFELNHIRLLNITLLLISVIRSPRGSVQSSAPSIGLAGYLLIGYIGLLVALTVIVSSFTNTMRAGLLLAIDFWVPFFVACNTLRTRTAIQEVAAAFALSGALLASLAILEFSKRWLLYAPLDTAMGVPWGYGSYQFRGEGGALRALVSTGHSIVLGYVIVVALACALMIAPRVSKLWSYRVIIILLLGGLIASVARGPWVGAVAMLIVALGIGQGAVSRLLKMFALLLILLGAVMVSPWGSEMLDYIPFIGTVDAGSVDYRSRLVEISLGVLRQSPVLGAWDYMLNPAMEEMRQGEGIIDMVNTYLGVAMSTGLVGLSLFIGVFIAAAWAAARRLFDAEGDADLERIGRWLLGALAGVLVTIATVSPINAVPTVYYLLVGILVAYSRLPAATGRPADLRPKSASLRASGPRWRYAGKQS